MSDEELQEARRLEAGMNAQEWRAFVLAELRCLREKLDGVRLDVAVFKTRHRIFAAAIGGVPAAAAVLLSALALWGGS